MEEQSKELSIKKKVQKKFPDFTSTADGMSLEDIKKNLSLYANYREQTELAKKKDEDLEKARESVKFIAGPYNDTIAALKLKLSYLHLLLAEKGE